MVATREEIIRYIQQSAPRYGVDPGTAVRVARSEGLNADPRTAWRSTARNKKGILEPSYGPLQFLVGGKGTGYPEGMGNDFMRATGLDPRNPNTWRQQVDYGMYRANRGGWSPWYGAKNAGIGRWQGINKKNQAQFPSQIARNTVPTPNPIPSKGIMALAQASPPVPNVAPPIAPAPTGILGTVPSASMPVNQFPPAPKNPMSGLAGLMQMAMASKMAQPAQANVKQDMFSGINPPAGAVPFAQEQTTKTSSRRTLEEERKKGRPRRRRAY